MTVVTRAVRAPALPNWDRLSRVTTGLAGIAVFLALAEATIRAGVIDERFVATPTAVIAELAREASTPPFWTAVGNTMNGWAIGLAITILTAVPLGLVLGSSRTAHLMFRWPVEFLRPIPPMALLPVAVLIYGNTLSMKVFLVVTGAFWPLLVQTIYGVKDTDSVAMDAARSYGLGRFAAIRRVVLPSALPYIFTGLRVSSTAALILAIGAEFIVGVPGLGAQMVLAYNSGAVVATYALVMAAGLLGMTTSLALRRLEGWALHWHPSQRSGHPR